MKKFYVAQSDEGIFHSRPDLNLNEAHFRGKILLFSSKTPNLLCLKQTLEAHNFRVEAFTDYEPTKAAFAASSVDVVVLDFDIISLRDVEFVRELSTIRSFAQSPAVAMAGFHNNGAACEFQRLAVSHYLTKPISRGGLCRIVESCICARSTYDFNGAVLASLERAGVSANEQ